MSTAAKITFATTCVVSAAIVYGVVKLQEDEREALHQGPIKDRERMRKKQEQKQLAQQQQQQQQELTAVQKNRASEYELQKQLREEYSKVQTVSGGPDTRA